LENGAWHAVTAYPLVDGISLAMLCKYPL